LDWGRDLATVVQAATGFADFLDFRPDQSLRFSPSLASHLRWRRDGRRQHRRPDGWRNGMRLAIALASGSIFGIGLVVSDMIDPGRVLAFLNLFSGGWDPTLAFVMGGGLLPMLAAWRFSARMEAPLSGGEFPSPVSSGPDRPLLVGAILFGIGWGLVGLCPGPAFSALLLGGWPVWVFILATVAGMAAHRFVLQS